MSKILTVFDDKDSISNVISVLSLDVDEVFYVYHHDLSKNTRNNLKKVITKYKNVVVNFIELTDDEKQIEEIVDRYDDLIIDVGGAKYLSLLLFDFCAASRQIIYYDNEENVLKDYRSHSVVVEDVFRLQIEDVVRLRGGEITGYMHGAIKDKKGQEAVVSLVENNLDNYSAFINFINRLNVYAGTGTYCGNNVYQLSEESLNNIRSDEVFKKVDELCYIKQDKLIFRSASLKKLTSVTGAFLENYLYIKLTESGYFDDVKMSCVIDFSEEKYRHPVVCELDCLIILNNHLMFVSCKSTKADTSALNEIYVHNSRFGNALSVPVFCSCEELDRNYPSSYAKAEELGIYVVDRSFFLNNRIADTFLAIANGEYIYDTL